MKSVLQVSETGGAGGAETVFLQLARHLSANGARLSTAVPAGGWLSDQLRAVDIGQTPLRISRSSQAFDFGLLRQLIAIIRAEHIDIVHSHCFGVSVYAAMAGFVTGTPVVCTLHGDPDLAKTRRFRTAKFRLLRLGAHRIVAVSHSLRGKLLASTPLAPQRTQVIFNGVAIDEGPTVDRDAIRASLNIESGAYVIGAVGNVRPSKAYQLLLRTAALMRPSWPHIRFMVVGDVHDALYRDLVAEHEALALGDYVQFLGFRDDAREIMRAFDAYVLPSHDEGFSLSLVQALEAGLPCVSTRSGGPEEIITDGVDGLLVPLNDPGALSSALERLMTHPDESAQLARAGRENVIRRFSLDRMLAAYDQLYAEVAES